ncbi:hypothetical protein AJ78_03586 [Emergomyces pasteurianus Ep9510]|uniref:Uncharacterized protein n=1 Tax=Emergomyces pasteurianus Ep9510 TaxID=1447872 RepID=A0A1J9PIH0_9EURO|nr:hypothetical protein AJ78_03586 [Emergomyces pasteurianus Ep9510]
MGSIWRLLTSSPGCQLDGDASRTQSSSVRPRRVKKDLHRRRSLAGLFTSSHPKESEHDITTLTCEERIHYPLYNPRDPRHNSDSLAYGSNGKGLWARYGLSIKSRLQGVSKSGIRSPNFQQLNPRRSIRSGLVSLTGSSRLMKRLSRSESPSKPHLSSIWEPQTPNRIGSREIASNSLLGQIDNAQFSAFPEPLSIPQPCLLPSLPSMSSGLMSPLELEACASGGFMEQETSYVQNYDTRTHGFNRPLQPFHILQNAVSSISSGQPLNEGYSGYTNTSNSSELLGPHVPSVQNGIFCAKSSSDQVSQKGNPPMPITPKRPPLHRQAARVANARHNANLPTLLSKQMHSRSSDLDNQIEEDERKPVENLANGRKTQSLLNLGEQWLETRQQQFQVVTPGVSQPSTATDSEFGVDLYRTAAKHRYASAAESDAVLSSWLFSLSCVSHTRDNTDISGSTLCRSPPPSTRHPSQVGQTGSVSTPVLRWQDGSVKESPRLGMWDCTGLVINDKVARDSYEESCSKSNSKQPGTTVESARLKKPSPPGSISNIPSENGRASEMPKAPLNLHLNLPESPSQLSNSLREPFCEGDLKTGANKTALWPGSVNSRIENGNLNQLSLAVDGHDTESCGEVEFIRKCQSIPVSRTEKTRISSCRGNAKTRSDSSDAINRVIIPTCKTSYVSGVETTADHDLASRERMGDLDVCDDGSKSSSNHKDGTSSCCGSGSGGSGQSDPLTNSTARTSVVDFASAQSLTTKANVKEGATGSEIGIKVLPTKGNAILLKN